MNVRYWVELSQAERGADRDVEQRQTSCPQSQARPDIAGGRCRLQRRRDCAHVAVGGSTVYRTKRRFVEGNLERALSEDPRPGAERKLTGKEEALLVATACANPPEGRARWTLELLADAMVKLSDPWPARFVRTDILQVADAAGGVSANLGKRYFDLPATDEPGEDVSWISIEIGCQERLRLEFALGFADEKPTDRHPRPAPTKTQ